MKVASSKEYLDFILEQLSGLNGITSKQMMLIRDIPDEAEIIVG